jgi:thiol-disulfide isomerase/thioredoxin
MRRTATAASFALVLAACGGSTTANTAAPSTSTTGAAPTPATTQAPGTTGAPGTTSTPSEPTTTRVRPDGEAAPDFTLALGDGGTFTLSEEQKPVYMVFWAEWWGSCRRELPVIDAVASDYLDEVTFLAVAGNNSDPDRTRDRVGSWFSPDRILWGLDESIWPLYNVPYQPFTVLISSDDVIIDFWFGVLPEEQLRARIDALVAVG